MKLSLAAVFALFWSCADAFAPVSRYSVSSSSTQTTISSASQLHLFGGGKKDDGAGAKKGPGMMDQLAMFKKAQEIAAKKTKLDTELAALTFEGVAADGKVKAMCKFAPSKNPMDPQPDVDTIGFEFDDEWYESASPEDLSAAVLEAIKNGNEKTQTAVAEKYATLQGDLTAALGGAMGGVASPES